MPDLEQAAAVNASNDSPVRGLVLFAIVALVLVYIWKNA